MTIVASILCIAIVATLHVTVVQKNPKLTNRVCITSANIILSLAFVVLLYAINTDSRSCRWPSTPSRTKRTRTSIPR